MNTETVVAAIITLVAGVLIGLLIGRGSKGKAIRQSAAIEAELDKTREEVEEYRNQVNQHFEKTAELVGELTDSYKDMTRRYKKVYEHLAQGAHTLASVDTSRMISSSTIDRLIYEANEDTHVAEKSAPPQPKPAAKAKPKPDTSSAAAPAPEKQKTEKAPQNKDAGKKAQQQKPDTKARTEQPEKRPKQPDTASQREEKEAPRDKKPSGGN